MQTCTPFLVLFWYKQPLTTILINNYTGRTLKQASSLARLRMNNHWVLSSRKRSRSFRFVSHLQYRIVFTIICLFFLSITYFFLTTNRPALKNWKKRLRLSVQLVLRLRSRELISPGNLKRSVIGLRRLVVPL